MPTLSELLIRIPILLFTLFSICTVLHPRLPPMSLELRDRRRRDYGREKFRRARHARRYDVAGHRVHGRQEIFHLGPHQIRPPRSDVGQSHFNGTPSGGHHRSSR